MRRTDKELLEECVNQMKHIDEINKVEPLATTTSLIREINLALNIPCVSKRSEQLIKFLTWYENEGRERYAECTHFSVVNEFNKI